MFQVFICDVRWVLSLSRWARFLLARDPKLITLTLQFALRSIFARQRLRARRLGIRGARTGAVTFVHYAEHRIMRSWVAGAAISRGGTSRPRAA
jgi:hypothetical protein